MSRRRLVLAGSAACLLLAGAWLQMGPPRLTALNTSLRIDYAAARVAGAAAAALGAGLLFAAATRRLPRVASAALGLLALGYAADLALYRVELTEAALLQRGLLSQSELPWSRISRVERAERALMVYEGSEPRLRLDTRRYTPDQRATLERGIARRVRQASAIPH